MTESDLQEKEIKQNFGYAFLLTSILRLHKHYMFSKMKLDRRENLGYKIKNPAFPHSHRHAYTSDGATKSRDNFVEGLI
jgi:hypothetical protein